MDDVPPVWMVVATMAWAASLGFLAARCALRVADHLWPAPHQEEP